ncbi:MAG: hypothetical protein CME70_08940 [Halobacteriovorax sp.]|nr:hypothetical protein [Halobacteriovorax sp.]|tara:strand:- start:55268 stop:56755 length:1488 start_codon:yes stop_codon:yes gene_type:complete
MKNIKIKVTLFSVSLLLSLVCAEVGLRLLGYKMLNDREAQFFDDKEKHELDKNVNEYREDIRIENKEGDDYMADLPLIEKEHDVFRGEVFEMSTKKKGHKFQYRVVALGDSVTNGGNVPLRMSYPYQLFNLQKKKGGVIKFDVYNEGICEHNTYTTYNLLKDNIHSFKPDILLVLSGEADRFNPVGRKPPEEEKGNFLSELAYKFNSVLHELRLYKIYRGIKLNSRLSPSERDVIYLGTNNLKRSIINYDWMQKAYAQVRKKNWDEANKYLKELKPDLRKELFFTGKEKDIDRKMFDIVEYNVLLIGDNYMAHGNYEDAVKHFSDVIVKFPFFFPLANEDNGIMYYLNWAISFQSTYSADYVLEKFEEIKRRFPEYAKTENFEMNYEIYRDYEKSMKHIQDTRIENLRNIVKYANKRNIKVVFLNYPADFINANKALEQVAKEYSLPFVDNNTVFKKLVERDGRLKWFEDDEHPTPAGYKVMADNVFKVLSTMDL